MRVMNVRVSGRVLVLCYVFLCHIDKLLLASILSDGQQYLSLPLPPPNTNNFPKL